MSETAKASDLRLIPLDHQRLLMVAGPDAETFLQGQLTCDLRRLDERQALLGAHCDHKGRMHSSLTLAHLQDVGASAVAMRTHLSVADTAAAALNKYMVFSKAELSVPSDAQLFALAGEGAAELAGSAVGEALVAGRFHCAPGLTVICHSEDLVEYWIAEPRNELLAELEPHCTMGTAADWDLLQIRRGQGEIRAETLGEFIPQHLNLQCLGGISFDKGCYTGQEVVARMHYLGKLKKHMYRGRTAAPAPAPNAAVYAGGERAAGQVVMAAADSSTGGSELLLVTSEQAVSNGQLTLASQNGPEIELLGLPYSLT